MNSKEALCCLDDIAHGRKMRCDPHELKNIIHRDLEVLEILKNKKVFVYWVSVCDVVSEYNSRFLQPYTLLPEEFELLKEWLNND